MNESNLCVSIPMELKVFCKKTEHVFISKVPKMQNNFGIKLFKKPNGEIEYAAYYSDSGELVKKVFYDGFKIITTEHFRNGKLHLKEYFSSDKLIRKINYDKNLNIASTVEYNYNRQDKISSVKKTLDKNIYLVEYGYDEFRRVNSRKIHFNGECINEQKYRFDILDRIVNYSDNNQNVNVLQISPKNELIYYKIIDKMNNEISVINHFNTNGYKNTDISLNGHTISITDRSYVDNIMLKKPYTSEDDLDLIISKMLNNNTSEFKTTRTKTDSLDDMINCSIQSRTLPISIRKRLLYNMSLNAS